MTTPRPRVCVVWTTSCGWMRTPRLGEFGQRQLRAGASDRYWFVPAHTSQRRHGQLRCRYCGHVRYSRIRPTGRCSFEALLLLVAATVGLSTVKELLDQALLLL